MTRTLDRLADRLMSSLPRTPLGTVTLTALAGVLIVAAAVHWLGWRLAAELLIAGVAGAGVWWALTPWRCRP